MPSSQSLQTSLPIALTMGDPAGIGTEITVLAWKKRQQHKLAPFFVLSRKSLFEKLAILDGFEIPLEMISSPEHANEVFSQALPVLELPQEVPAIAGKSDPSNGAMTILSISQAVELVKKGQAASVVTNPINKHVLYEAGFEFPGHTEYLAKLAEQWGKGSVRPVMMLASRQLRAVPLTIHIALSQVAEHITSALIMETARIISNDLTRFFGLKSPRIAVAGLNPHAGENGTMGTAEIDIIEPALNTLKGEGINVSGPHPADTLFHAAARETYDVVIGMYHDQALIPIKTLSFDEGVNTTLGLPFVRTSPDHGTAYDIAGKGVARPTSLIEALKLANDMSHQSQIFDQSTEHGE
ncbi:MAG: 4-hydroxythreonine-4-phosphate dehydrogenase PdxA [bacterium]|nr:4-hydroxythreonine-4-phosphate dehydrogenase PdxA [bacterium]